MHRNRKKARVPSVLHKLFKNRAQTLASAIISIIKRSSSSTETCSCRGRGCLQCRDEDASSFLFRPDDPPMYRRLLNRCFVVVNTGAPPMKAFYPRNTWTQDQFVRRTIEMMLCEDRASSNVICSGYNKSDQSSPIVKLLTGPAWDILLQRVGDELMFYLLKNTSIFLPIVRKKHHQVSGSPIRSLFRLSKHTSESPWRFPSASKFGPRTNRSRVDNSDSMLARKQSVFIVGDASSNDGHSSSLLSSNAVNDSDPMDFSGASTVTTGSINQGHETCSNLELHNPRIVAANSGKRRRPFSGKYSRKRRQLGFLDTDCTTASMVTRINESARMKNVAIVTTCQESPDEEFQNSTKTLIVPRKHSRLLSWQRRRNRRQLNFLENNSKNLYEAVGTEEQSLRLRLRSDSNNSTLQQHGKLLQLCSCCSLLQLDSHLAKGRVEIDRKFMFYQSKSSASLFPRGHILNSVKPNLEGSRRLIMSIFGLSDVNVGLPSAPCSHCNGVCLIGSACQYHSLLKLLKILIRRTQCCQHLRLMDKHCPVPSLEPMTIGNAVSIIKEDVNCGHLKENLTMDDLNISAVECYCSKSQVASFIWSICRSIVPPEFLGTLSNQKRLRRNVSKFIHLRRFEKFSLKQCMHRVKTSEFQLLSTKQSSSPLNNRSSDAAHRMNQKFVKCWTSWFFSCLIVPLVQTHFYITENQHRKHDIYYYRKSVWEKLKQGELRCLKDANYQRLDEAGVRKIICNRSFGFSKIRLYPKENGVRVLANLTAPSKMPLHKSFTEMRRRPQDAVKFKNFKPVNFILRDLHAVLKGLLLKEPEKLGASVFDYNDIYKRLGQFRIGLKNSFTTLPELFIVASDVSKAFDSIDQDKLLSIMNEVIVKDCLLQQFYHVVCTKKNLLYIRDNIALKDASISSDSLQSTSYAPCGPANSVLINLGLSRCVNKEELLFNLTQHVTRNVLFLDNKFYLQTIGIPQGGVCSTLLCSLYYGHLENKLLIPFLEKTNKSLGEVSRSHICDGSVMSSNYLLLRFIDDFLFISTSKDQASGFFSRLQRGFRDYNCSMNKSKFCSSFDLGGVFGPVANTVCMGEDGNEFVRWSGLLLNCRTLEVQADYTRYLTNNLDTTLTVSWHGKPGRHLKRKLLLFMRPKCHPIFFDSHINSAAVIRLNIFQIFLLSAMKFHCYVRELSYIHPLPTRYHFTIIKGSLRYMKQCVKKKMRVGCYSLNFQPLFEMKKGEIKWLGLNAFIQALKRKQSKHKKLLLLLKCTLMKSRIVGNVSSELKYAIDPLHSSLMWKIKY